MKAKQFQSHTQRTEKKNEKNIFGKEMFLLKMLWLDFWKSMTMIHLLKLERG